MVSRIFSAPVEAVIFDMDGLLLDSERIALDCVAAAAAEMGLAWPYEVGLAMVGLNSRDSYAMVKQRLGQDFPMDELQAGFGRLYEAAIDAGRIPAKPGAHELLQALVHAGVRRAVATSTRRSRALPKLEGAGLLAAMEDMVCGDEVSRGKPAPDIFLAAAAKLGKAPAQCLVLEDSNAGVRGALAAGMRVIMVPDLLQPAEDVLAAGVPRAASLHEVLAAFASSRL